jgi:hypothetical protein
MEGIMRVSKWALAGAVAAGLCGLAGPVEAGILKVLTNSVPIVFTDNDRHQIPLDNAGDNSVTFSTFPTQPPVVFTFNAQCLAQGPQGSYLSLTITVDGHPTDPKSQDGSAFCAPSGANNMSFVSAVRITSSTFVKENKVHVVRIQAQGINTTGWRLDNGLLMIQQ